MARSKSARAVDDRPGRGSPSPSTRSWPGAPWLPLSARRGAEPPLPPALGPRTRAEPETRRPALRSSSQPAGAVLPACSVFFTAAGGVGAWATSVFFVAGSGAGSGLPSLRRRRRLRDGRALRGLDLGLALRGRRRRGGRRASGVARRPEHRRRREAGACCGAVRRGGGRRRLPRRRGAPVTQPVIARAIRRGPRCGRRRRVEDAGELALDPGDAQLDPAQRLTQLGRSPFQEVDAPGLGVEHLDLALEVVARRRLHRLLDGVELRAGLLRDAVRVLRAGALCGLDARPHAPRDRRGGGPPPGAGAATESGGAGAFVSPAGFAPRPQPNRRQAGRQDRRDRHGRGEPAPRPGATWDLSGPGRSHAHRSHRSTRAVSGSTNGPLLLRHKNVTP